VLEEKYLAEGRAAHTMIRPKENAAYALFEQVLTRGSASGDRQLRIYFSGNADKAILDHPVRGCAAHGPRSSTRCEPDWVSAGAEQIVSSAFHQVLANTYPTDILQAVRTENPQMADIRVEYALHGERIFSATHHFKILLVSKSRKPDQLLREFTVSAPDENYTLRKASLFAPPLADPMYSNVCIGSARAFDQFYDELYSLFFSGPIRIPIQAAATPIAPWGKDDSAP
jgi:hypothetical protein